jgi:hypothetical protein
LPDPAGWGEMVRTVLCGEVSGGLHRNSPLALAPRTDRLLLNAVFGLNDHNPPKFDPHKTDHHTVSHPPPSGLRQHRRHGSPPRPP